MTYFCCAVVALLSFWVGSLWGRKQEIEKAAFENQLEKEKELFPVIFNQCHFCGSHKIIGSIAVDYAIIHYCENSICHANALAIEAEYKKKMRYRHLSVVQ